MRPCEGEDAPRGAGIILAPPAAMPCSRPPYDLVDARQRRGTQCMGCMGGCKCDSKCVVQQTEGQGHLVAYLFILLISLSTLMIWSSFS
jgi:hypothetical protein